MSRRGLAVRFSPLRGAGEAAPRRMRALVERTGASAVFAEAGLQDEADAAFAPRASRCVDILGARAFGAAVVVGAAAAFGEIEGRSTSRR